MGRKRLSRTLSFIDQLHLVSFPATRTEPSAGAVPTDAPSRPENAAAGSVSAPRAASAAGARPRELDEELREMPQVVEMYGLPTPPKSYFFIGAGYAYGIGCGIGPFYGVGVAFGPQPLFGAGVGVGAFCGAGLGTGLIVGNGAGYIPFGASTSFFYTPRIVWAERIISNYRYQNGRPRRRKRKRFGLGTVLEIIRRSFQKLR